MDERQQFLEQLSALGPEQVRENLERDVYTISWKRYLAEEYVRRAPAAAPSAPEIDPDQQYERERILLEELQRANARAGSAMMVAVLALLLGLAALVMALAR